MAGNVLHVLLRILLLHPGTSQLRPAGDHRGHDVYVPEKIQMVPIQKKRREKAKDILIYESFLLRKSIYLHFHRI